MSNEYEMKIEELEKRITELEEDIPYTYLLSHSFLRRAFTILGHLMIAQLIIMLPLTIIIYLFTGRTPDYGY